MESTTEWKAIVNAENATDELTLKDLVRLAAYEILREDDIGVLSSSQWADRAADRFEALLEGDGLENAAGSDS